MTAGALQAAAFFVGTAAQDASDRVVYNPTNGILLFDADGVGGAAGLKLRRSVRASR